MNRRSFITKALAGVVAIPLLPELVNSQPSGDVLIEWKEPKLTAFETARGPVWNIKSITIDSYFHVDLLDVVTINRRRYEITSVEISGERTTIRLRREVRPIGIHDTHLQELLGSV